MPSFFVNRDGPSNRRNIRSVQGQQGGPSPLKELMLLPSFDTFIFHKPTGACGGDRWDFLPNGNNPSISQEIPIGLFNPWNDGGDAPNGSTQAPRTPTRAVLAFDMRNLTPNANILSADLVLTVGRSNNWTSDAQ